MKIDCPFKGCNGVIDISKQIFGWPKHGRTSWLVHGLLCPKCSNFVGQIEIGATFGVNLSKRNRRVITDIKTKKLIYGVKDLNPYLKDWAKQKKVKKNG